MAFTSSQWKALAIIPHFSSFLSMMGDAWIVYDILWHRKRVKKLVVHSYHRILLMMSIWDFIVISFGKFLASWAMPENTPNVWYAAGTQQTCTMQGFSIQFSLIVPMYNAMVALYYLLVIRFGLSNEVIEKKYERWMHICPFVISLAFAITGLVPSMQLYAPSTMWCWMNSVPKGCIQSYEGKGPTTCTRGDNSYIYRLAFYYAPIWLCIAFTATSMIIIYRSMKSQETKTKRYKYTAGTSGDNNERPMARSSLFGSLRGTANKSKITTKVATQSYFYVGGFLMVWTFPTINRILGFFNKKYFPLTVLHAIFSPLQGFVNFVVYIRPRLITFIKEQKKRTDGKRSTCSLLRDFFLFMETATDEGYMRASRTSAGIGCRSRGQWSGKSTKGRRNKGGREGGCVELYNI
jgi:hypothetical protein